MDRKSGIEVNGRRYRWPREPLVAVCVDGCDSAYIDEVVRAGAAPCFAQSRAHEALVLAGLPGFACRFAHRPILALSRLGAEP